MFEITIVKYHENKDSEYIGRGAPLGNPFHITPSDSRDSVCDKYEDYFYEQLEQNNPVLIKELKRVYAKGTKEGYIKLGCFCGPHIRCHGETIKRFFENNEDNFFNHE